MTQWLIFAILLKNASRASKLSNGYLLKMTALFPRYDHFRPKNMDQQKHLFRQCLTKRKYVQIDGGMYL